MKNLKSVKMNISRNVIAIFVIIGAILININCSDDIINSTADNLDISSMGTNDSSDNSGNILILDTVKILLRDIKLNVSNGEDSTNFKVGPFVLFLNLNSSVNFITSAYIPPGVYDKIKFEIHKLNDNEVPPDPEFADANGRYSVIVKGWFNGNYFIYKSKKSAHQKLNFPGMLQISNVVRSNVTLQVRPYIWFMENGDYLDPRDPSNENNIDNNIKDNINNNFKAFKDNDKNGIPDN
jgi:hypothetical protein